jgi:hypothetical protein
MCDACPGPRFRVNDRLSSSKPGATIHGASTDRPGERRAGKKQPRQGGIVAVESERIAWGELDAPYKENAATGNWLHPSRRIFGRANDVDVGLVAEREEASPGVTSVTQRGFRRRSADQSRSARMGLEGWRDDEREEFETVGG